ncbi:MAG: hypothetical protein KC657_14280, partial [Myxococcales bacterium]|nr:hypothetical protein [Myxococcales bacterium]
VTRASSTRREHDAPAGVRGPIVATASAASLFAMGGFAIYGARVGVSVMVGGLIAVANLAFLAGLVRSLTTPRDDDDGTTRDARDAESDARDAESDEASDAHEPDADGSEPKEAATSPDDRRARDRSAGRRGGLAWGLLAVVKIVVLFGGMWLLLTRGWVDPIALLVGYGALPLGISAGTLGRALRP